MILYDALLPHLKPARAKKQHAPVFWTVLALTKIPVILRAVSKVHKFILQQRQVYRVKNTKIAIRKNLCGETL